MFTSNAVVYRKNRNREQQEISATSSHPVRTTRRREEKKKRLLKNTTIYRAKTREADAKTKVKGAQLIRQAGKRKAKQRTCLDTKC